MPQCLCIPVYMYIHLYMYMYILYYYSELHVHVYILYLKECVHLLSYSVSESPLHYQAMQGFKQTPMNHTSSQYMYLKSHNMYIRPRSCTFYMYMYMYIRTTLYIIHVVCRCTVYCIGTLYMYSVYTYVGWDSPWQQNYWQRCHYYCSSVSTL